MASSAALREEKSPPDFLTVFKTTVSENENRGRKNIRATITPTALFIRIPTNTV